MAVTYAVDGVSYSSINAACTAIEASHDYSTDGIANIEIQQVYEDTAAVTVDAASAGTPSTTNYIKITVASAYRHSGVYGTGHARLKTTSSSHSMTINEDYVVVEYLQVEQAGTTSSAEAIRVVGNHCVISRNIIKTNNTTQQDGVYPSGAITIYADNNVFQDCYRAGLHAQSNAATVVYADHNTFINCGDEDVLTDPCGGLGAKQSAVTVNAYNNLAIDCYGATKARGFNKSLSPTWIGDFNISSDQTASDTSAEDRFGATNNWGSVDVTELTEPTAGEWVWVNDHDASYDVGIKGENTYTVTQNGTDRSGLEPDPRQDFSIDIVGTTRSAPTIGAFEYVVVGGAVATAILKNNLGVNLFRGTTL